MGAHELKNLAMAGELNTQASTRPYTRAPGMGRHQMGRVRLWYGDFDLLQVTSVPGRESYERMPYANIQAVIMAPTNGWRWRLGIATTLSLILGLLGRLGSMGFYELLLLTGLPLLWLIVELLLGPTCECYVVTGVERYRLYPWSRRRTAMKGIRRLSERVRAAQQGSAISP